MQIINDFDAAGLVPAPMTSFEQKMARETVNGEMIKKLRELERKQALPLEDKISLSLERINDWYEAWGGAVSVSYSGGKDSSVLLWLVRRLYSEVPAVFINTGLEYPELVKHVLNTPNGIILRPKMHFSKVIEKYGWPIGSKKIARGVSFVRRPSAKNANTRRLFLEGINQQGRSVHGFKIAKQWRFLFDAPFNCSDRCCDVMKKKPQTAYEKATGRAPFVGTMAADGKQREMAYLQSGQCNAYDRAKPKSAPMSFWTEQDVLACIKKYNIPIPSVYGDIITQPDGLLATTGVRRTGCVFCCFGLSLDEGPVNRFELLAETHPKLHKYVMDKLGLREVLNYCRQHAPARLAKAFRAGGRQDMIDSGRLF